MVDGCQSKLVNVVSGVAQGSVFGQLLFLVYTSELFSILKNKLSVMLPPGVRVTVAESLILDLHRVSEWCNLWGMKLNASKTKTMIVSSSRTMHPSVSPINYWRNCAEGV